MMSYDEWLSPSNIQKKKVWLAVNIPSVHTDNRLFQSALQMETHSPRSDYLTNTQSWCLI